MSRLVRLLKYSKYIGNLSKHIRINDVRTNFRSLSHISSNVASTKSSKSANHVPQYKQNEEPELCIDGIIKQMDDQYKETGIISKCFIEQIIQHVKETAGQIETSQALLVLRCTSFLPQCMPQDRIKFSATLWELLNSYHVPINVSHYNALLQIYIENGHKFSPLEILSNMKKQGILPNNTTYKYLLQYYCKNGNMSNSETVLECMKEENCPINESILNLLILGYSEAGDLTGAINILDIMKNMDVAPSEETYTAVMCAYAKVNDIKKIKEVLSHCKKKGMKFSDKHMLDVIYTLIVNNNMHHINQIIAKIENPSHTAKIYFLSKIMDTKQDVAMEVLSFILSLDRYKANYNQLACFFIIKLINSNVSSDKIIDACIHLETKYNDKKAFSQAIYYSFKYGDNIMTLDLLKAWKRRGHKLRPHYFWPILTKLIEKNNIQDLLHNIKEMITTYDVIPCLNTLTNFFIPHVFCNVYDVRNELYKYGIPHKIIDNAIVYDFLQANKIRRAASYITLNKNVYQKSELKDVLIQALHNTCDISSFFVIVRNLSEETESGEEKLVSINDAILDMMNFLSARQGFIPLIIKYLYDNQLKVSDDVYKALSQHLSNNLSPDISKQLVYITEDSLLKQEWPQSREEQIEIANLKSELMNSPITSNVMSSYMKFLILKKDNNVLSYNKYVSLLDSLFQQNLRNEGKTIIKHLVTDHPFIFTLKLVLDRAKYLISLGYFNDAAEIIEHASKVIKIKDNKKISLHITNLLITTVAQGNEEEVNNLINILSEARYLSSSENLLHPFMTVYIQQNNIIKALEAAELLCEKYQYIPGLTKLTKLIVLAEDTNLLQRFIDITTKVYELQYILGELLLCFLENDYDKEAKRIVELLVTSNYNFTSIKANILTHVRKKNAKLLSKLLDCTEAYANMDRLFIYKCLFDIYSANNDYQSGLQLRARMTKEGMLPTQDITRTFENLIEHNNIDKSLIPN